jgi:hypothetical protein
MRAIAVAALLGVAFPGISPGAEEEPDVAPGLYRLEMIMASIARLPLFGSSKSASRSLSLVEIRRNGSEWVQRHEVCDFRVLEDSAMIRLVFPDKFVGALRKQTSAIRWERDAQGWRYHADLGVERIGYRADTGDDKLPDRIDDPAVFDWDGDGFPGATLKLSVPLLPDGEIYIVQTGHSVLNGRLNGSGTIEGGIDVRRFEQRVLGARPGFLNRSPEIRADPERSRFIMTPLPAGADCRTVVLGAAH